MVKLLPMGVLAGVALALPAAQPYWESVFVDIETITATALSASPTDTSALITSTPKPPTIVVPKPIYPDVPGGVPSFPPMFPYPDDEMPKIKAPSGVPIYPEPPGEPSFPPWIRHPDDEMPIIIDPSPIYYPEPPGEPSFPPWFPHPDDEMPIIRDPSPAPIISVMATGELPIVAQDTTLLKKVKPSTDVLPPWRSATEELLQDLTITRTGLPKTPANTATPTTTETPAWDHATRHLVGSLYSPTPTEIPDWIAFPPLPVKTESEQPTAPAPIVTFVADHLEA